MHKIQATTARAFQKTEMSRKYQSNSASVDSATTDENQLPTQNLSASQWNPQLMTLNKYPDYIWNTGHQPFPSCSRDREHSQHCGAGRDGAGTASLPGSHSLGAEVSLVPFWTFHSPTHPALANKAVCDHVHLSCRSPLQPHMPNFILPFKY